MSHPRVDNVHASGQLRVILPASMENMPPPFMDINNMQEIPPPQADFSAPPPYDVAANSKLPTYEEVQREKQMEGEGPPQCQPKIWSFTICRNSPPITLTEINQIRRRYYSAQVCAQYTGAFSVLSLS
ncbi:hypothetical protein O3G_MSEX008509 [Manduca sexta]|uniref:Uncharacterized protein n=1 Tax=Manduca sexta TaxID=7130 RepID=A0A921ZC99_MANSE|nr:hypothetical protein O3G_MSEX008509 [Manduca sexta]